MRVRVIIIVLVLGVVIVSISLVSALARVNLFGNNEGYRPEQPIAYSHRVHAGELTIPCLYCHPGAERSRHAGIPSSNVCMNCHRYVTATLGAIREEERLAEEENRDPRPLVSPELEKLYDALALDEQLLPDPQREEQPIEWTRVHRLPDFAYFDHRPHEFVVPHRGEGCLLRNRADIARAVALQGVDHPGPVERRDRVSHPPSRHREGLGQTTDHAGAIGKVGAKGKRRNVAPLDKYDVLVDLVGDQERIGGGHPREHRAHLLLVPGRTGRVRRTVQQEQAETTGQSRIECVEIHRESLVGGTIDEHGLATEGSNLLGVGHPVGSRNPDAVPGISGRGDRIIQGLLRPVGDDNIGSRVLHTATTRAVAGDGFAQRHDPGCRGVSEVSFVEGTMGSRNDGRGRGQIRLTDREVEHGLSRRGHGLRLRRELERHTRLNDPPPGTRRIHHYHFRSSRVPAAALRIAMAAVSTISDASQPRLRSNTGRASPWTNGPTARHPPSL